MSVVERTPAQMLQAQVRSPEFREQVALALPEGMPPERFVRVALTALQANPDIATWEHTSVFRALIECASMGLLPDGREAAIAPFKGKARLMVMIGGYRKYAADYGWTIRTKVVYAADEFDYELGLNARLVHRPARPGVERGARVAVYAIATHRDGRREFDVMLPDEVEKVRQASQQPDKGPWRDWTDAMWEKSVGRRIFPELAFDSADKRISMLLAETTNPAAAIYGPPVLPSVTRRLLPPVPGEIVDGATVPPVAVSQQAPADAPSSAGVPGDHQEPDAEPQSAGNDDDEPVVGEPEPEPEEQPAFPIPADVQEQLAPSSPEEIEAAWQTVVPKGSNEGRTLRDIAATVGGPEWLNWAADRAPSYWSKGFRRQLELVLAQQEQAS